MNMDIVNKINGKVKVTRSESICFLMIAHMNANAWI
jgi:hypothetical protein